jgi:hypothetical protein
MDSTHSEKPHSKTKSGWLSRLFGKNAEGKTLYWGPAKLDVLCISIYVFDRQYFDALNADIMMNVVDQIIPSIKDCNPKDIRLSYSPTREAAFSAASRLLNEPALANGSLIYGEMGVNLSGTEVYFALSIIAGGGKKNLVTIMKKSTHWAENLKVR